MREYMKYSLVKFDSLWTGVLLTTKATRKELFENESTMLSIKKALFGKRVRFSNFNDFRYLLLSFSLCFTRAQDCGWHTKLRDFIFFIGCATSPLTATDWPVKEETQRSKNLVVYQPALAGICHLKTPKYKNLFNQARSSRFLLVGNS